MNSRLLVPALFLAAALAPQTAHAQYGLSSSSNSDAFGDNYPAGPGFDPHSDSHTGIIGPVNSIANSRTGFLYADGSGGASGIANYGSIHADAGGGGEGGSGSGSDTVRWFDTLTVTSPTLPLGSPVTLLATASYSGTLSGSVYSGLAGTYPDSADGQASVTLKSDIGGFALPYAASLDAPSPGGAYFTGSFQIFNSLPISQTLQQTVSTYVGATLTLDSEIDLSASGVGNGFKVSGNGFGSVDSVFNVQSQTAGVTLLRSSAVPEPSAPVTVLLGAVMAGLLLSRRRFARRWD